ncbi:MAG: bifunctional phosphopantothenoylcysteine decarboxylase/phosphopantothenate--cysteine ligase CoaBC [Flavobacteriales bacterium]
MLSGKKILVGISGSIAAYKTNWLIRLLIQSGAEVKVVLTPSALDFVTPLTLSTLSKNPVYSDFTEDQDKGTWTNHVALALWADVMVIAPASSNTLSKMVSGQSDNFLMTTYMSTRCPVIVAPAMDHDMYVHPATQENLQKLRSFGHLVVTPGEGELASGLMGKGRMGEPEEMYEAIVKLFHPNLPLSGKKVIVTAGPTYEMIDPVRFIGNFSSGKMGFALAEALANRGALVKLISGPTHLSLQHPHIEVIRVRSAQEMLEAALSEYADTDITVLAAAVADYRPAQVAFEKIKKVSAALEIKLEPTPDIAAHLGKLKKGNQLNIGFALETNDEENNAKSKLERKNFDMIVLNSLRNEGAGFGTDTNQVTLFTSDNKRKEFGLKTKTQVAEDIVQEIIGLMR